MYKQKALALTDLDATNYELEQKVLANSMESYFRQEHDRKQKASTSLGRRRRSSPPPVFPIAEGPIDRTSSDLISSETASVVASMIPESAVASLSPVVSAAESWVSTAASYNTTDEEYPQTVQELVMNGFELEKVLRAYDLVGDHFDDLLSFLLSSTGS